MARIEKFEDIEAWQKARVLCREIYNLTSQLISGLMRYLANSSYQRLQVQRLIEHRTLNIEL